MQCLDNKLQKLVRSNSREMRAKRDQTFSAQKGSAPRCGNFGKSLVDPDDPRGLIRMYAASRGRKVKVTLVPMPWDNKKKG